MPRQILSDEMGDGVAERGLGLLRSARRLRGLTPIQVERIAARLQGRPVPFARRRLVAALAGLALLLSAATALAWATGNIERLPILGSLLGGTRRSFRAPPPHGPPAPVRPPRPVDLSGGGSATPSPHPSTMPSSSGEERTTRPAPIRAAPVTSPAPRRPAAAAARRDAPPPTPAEPPGVADLPAPPESPIVDEGRSFAEVLRLWRQQHRGQAALAALDVHDRRFGVGQMALESRLLRVEILVSQRRGGEALAILDDLPLGAVSVPRGRELLTVRGELRVEAGRCREARTDLAAIAAGSDPLGRRARDALTHCP